MIHRRSTEATMNVMRYTVVDPNGVTSFIGPCEALRPLLMGCVGGAATLEDLLRAAERSGAKLIEPVTSGLAVFDEHNAYGNYAAIHGAIEHLRPYEIPPFRVVDDRTRQASLQPVKAGAIIFNLPKRRIVQLQNLFTDVARMVVQAKRLQRAGWQILP
jgi:hypothetical protein